MKLLGTLLLAGVAFADTSNGYRSLDPKNCGLLRTLVPHTGGVSGCAVSPNGALLATVGQDGKLNLISTSSWHTIQSVDAHGTNGACAVDFSADGKMIVTTGMDHQVRVWDGKTAALLKTFSGQNGFRAAFSPDGKLVASPFIDQTIKIWDVANGNEVHSTDLPSVCTITRFTPDGKFLVAACIDGTVKIWSTGDWSKVRDLACHNGGVTTIAVTSKQAITGGEDGMIRFWDVGTGDKTNEFTQGGAVSAITLTRDGKYLITASQDCIKIWDATRRTCLTELKHHTSTVHSLAVSPDSRYIFSAAQDAQVKVWGYRAGGMAHVKPKGFLGVTVSTGADGTSCVVNSIIPDSAAEKAGLQVGDVLKKVAGKEIKSYIHAIGEIGSFFEGDSIEFTIERDGAEKTIKTTLGKRPENVER